MQAPSSRHFSISRSIRRTPHAGMTRPGGHTGIAGATRAACGLLLIVLLGVTGCSPERGCNDGDLGAEGDGTVASPVRESAEAAEDAVPTAPLRIAEQHGIAYAPLAVLQIEGILEERLQRPVEWVRLGNATAIREAMLADRLDVGFMGIPPYLIGRDRGMEWVAFTGLSRAPLGLVTLDPTITSLHDLVAAGPRARIALPQPGSIQHILLAMALEGAGLDAGALDTRLVSLGHPDGMTALLAGGEIRAHFTAPPFLTRELAEPGARLLVDGTEAFGQPFTFIIGVARSDQDVPVAAVRAAVEEAITRLGGLEDLPYPPAAGSSDGGAEGLLLSALAAHYGLSEAEVHRQLREEGVDFGTAIEGMSRFEDGMRQLGYLTGEG
jgi:NitT/TauT family transport system substrate-binding protein